jgi:hypothetical protein
MDGFWQSVIGWNDLGPVAILFFILMPLIWLCRWLLQQLLADKRAQITRLETMNDRLTNETAATLKQILDAVRQKETRS